MWMTPGEAQDFTDFFIEEKEREQRVQAEKELTDVVMHLRQWIKNSSVEQKAAAKAFCYDVIEDIDSEACRYLELALSIDAERAKSRDPSDPE